MTVFAKRDHLGANLDFEFCIQRESTLHELSVALYCASLAGSVSEIRLRKVWNYEKCVIKKTALKHLLPVKPQHSAFFRVTEHQVSFATFSVTLAPSGRTPPLWTLAEYSGRPPKASALALNCRKLTVWSCAGLQERR